MDDSETKKDSNGNVEIRQSSSQSSESHPFLITLGIIIIALFFIKYLFLLTLGILLFVGSILAVLISGAHFIKIPRPSTDPIRTKFTRLSFTRKERWNDEVAQLQINQDLKPQANTGPLTSEIDGIIDLILRDFVSSWFSHISNDQSFPFQVKVQLKLALSELEARIYMMNVSNFLILEILPIITNHFSSFVAAEDIVLGEQRNKNRTNDLDVRVAKEFIKLHPAISFKDIEKQPEVRRYSRDKVGGLIQYLLSKDEQSSSTVLVLVRELLSNAVFVPVIQLLSDSDFWNQTIIKVASATLKDRVQVREIRNAIDKQYKRPSNSSIPTISKNPLLDIKITPNMRQPEFEKYLKAIGKSESASILKQLKYYYAIQISRTHKIRSNSEKFLKYRKRLHLANSLVDKQLSILNDQLADNPRNSVILDQGLDGFISGLTLSQVLSNPSSLSFFMEFMEQRSRTILLQYWLTVDGIKDPLEDPKDPDYEEELSSSVDMTGAQDIEQIFHRFFDQRLLKVKKEVYNEVKNFAEGHERSLNQYIQVRKFILMLQEDVFHRMEERDLADFKNSDLFLKLLSSEAFEESLVNQVDFAHEPSFDEFAEDSGQETPPPELISESQYELESVLTDLIGSNDNYKRPSLSKSESTDSCKKLNLTQNLRNEIFGSPQEGFLTEKPLFNDDSGDEDDEINDEEESVLSDSKLEVDPDFFSVSHDVLNLKEEIRKFEEDIERLNRQSDMLDPLILKAELINNTNELRILKKSKASYQREIESKELQKQQLILEDNDNSLFGKTSVNIDSWVKGTSHGKDYILYVIEIQKSSTGKNGTGWITGRRFSQFHRLNELLRKRYPAVDQIPFPKKKLILKFQQKALIDERRFQLQYYLRKLLEIEDVCCDKEFRKFLTTQDYKVSLADSEIPSPVPSARSRLEDTASKLYSGFSNPLEMLNTRTDSSENLQNGVNDDDSYNQNVENVEEMQKELDNFDSQITRLESQKSFIKPVTDLVIALFSLNKPNSWLRGRAIIVVLQQIFGSTIEKHIKDLINGMTTQERIISTIGMLRNILWPNGEFMKSSIPRTTKEKNKSVQEARVLLETLMIDACSKIVGQPSAKSASNKIGSMLQNDILNRSLVYEIFDKILDEIFPEINK
ncbi:Structural protein MDM1 [Wickerhamomyces ciferrii]|uniref:Structural protein MDM1 n=1 Tax=Wickerhamomyces ciferrii (strain ATCC 14091 / BCRC 22168 / CBS 111 / JCM 3599 / NBRC 0793 / NRRL Y-1031 F-60-10) TaxID=1206466 RepID=K0KW18_WICCF|nr:Structural protein MDM1 [Wickerhamomyces ciferrii]CCH45318.1 Structural protein MDM1 [Wickerhamomyces ciferrii]